MSPGQYMRRRLTGLLAAVFAAASLSGCAGVKAWLPADGPSAKQVHEAPSATRVEGIQVVSVDDKVARSLLSRQKQRLFSEEIGASVRAGYVIGLGDVVEVSVWEAPPAALFGGVSDEFRPGIATSRATTFPEQMVGDGGTINVPFAVRCSM